MIESTFRKIYQKYCVDPLLKMGLFRKIHPSLLTGIGCVLGVSIFPLLAFHFQYTALLFLAISGYLDTLDGSVARLHGKTSNIGAALDIVSDRIVEACIIFGLFFVDPNPRAFLSLLMLGSILICVTSFLIVGVFSQNSSEKSFHYSPGLIERAEAFLFFAAMIVFPGIFALLAIVFSALVLLTSLVRMLQFHLNSLKSKKL